MAMEESMYGENHSCDVLRDYIIKSPPLEKVFAHWRLRYFVLHDNRSKVEEIKRKNIGHVTHEVTLNYYESETYYKSGEAPYGSINIKFAQIRRLREKVHGYRFVLEIVTPQRAYYLCFTSELLCNKWLDMMTQLHREAWAAEENNPRKVDRTDDTDTISQDSGFLGCHTNSNASSVYSNTGNRNSTEVQPEQQQQQHNHQKQQQRSSLLSPPLLTSKRISALRERNDPCYSSSMDNLNTATRSSIGERESSANWTTPASRRSQSLSDNGVELPMTADGSVDSGLTPKATTIPRDLNSLKDFVDNLEKRRPSSPMSPYQRDMLSRLAQQKQANIQRIPSNAYEFRGPVAAQSLSSSLQNLATT